MMDPVRRCREFAYRLSIRSARRLLAGPHAWRALGDLGVPGFGTNLVRLFFPVRVADPVWSPESGPQRRIAEALAGPIAAAGALGEDFAAAARRAESSLGAEGPDSPFASNMFLGLPDAAMLSAMIARKAPGRFVEIGSGFSTRVARCTIDSLGLETRIVSIDPAPRADIDALADEVVRQPFEEAAARVAGGVQPGDLVFLDGSHYVFPGNDTTVFFMEFLPSLPPGVLVHVHDIYWPHDYPAGQTKQMWSEQYLVGAWLMGGGAGMDVLAPMAALRGDERFEAPLRAPLELAGATKAANAGWSSFWFEWKGLDA